METSIHPQFSSYYLGTIICSWTKGEKHPLNWNHRINGGPKEPESLGQLFHLLFNTANRLSNTLQSNTRLTYLNAPQLFDILRLITALR